MTEKAHTAVPPRKLEKLIKRLHLILEQNALDLQREVILQFSKESDYSTLDFAAALLFASQPHLFQNQAKPEALKKTAELVPFNIRNVRYRLDIGSRHNFDPEHLLQIIIEESGVERNRISRLEIRDNYTLIDLPDGMPADIFQLLNEVSVADRKLNIKRVKPNRRRFREARKTIE